MKKRICLLLCLLLVLVFGCTMTACSIPTMSDSKDSSSSRDRNDDEDEDEDDEDDEDDNDDEDNNDDDEENENDLIETGESAEKYVYSYVEDYYEYTITVTTCEDGSCTVEERTDYNSGCTYTSIYFGEYTMEDGEIHVCYEGPEDFTNIIYIVSGSEIIDYKYEGIDDTDTSEIEGMYTCNNSDYGRVKLRVNDDGTAVVLINNVEMDASIFLFNGEWDLMFFNSEYNEDCDWYVFFDGSSFSYIPYGQVSCLFVEGDYVLDGSLGFIDMSVDAYGDCVAGVTIDGNIYDFYGSVYGEEGVIKSIYMSNEEFGYSLELEVVPASEYEADYMYSGCLQTTVILSAG